MTFMTPEERFERIERTLEFLAASQAQLTASVQSHDALIAETSRKISQLTDLTLRIGHCVEEQGRQTDERIRALVEAQARTDASMGDLAGRINALINVAERYFSNGRH